MASDEELARRFAEVEGETRGGDSGSGIEEFDEYKDTASEIHDELARRIREVEDDAVDAAELADVVERLDDLESRIEALEAGG